MDDGKALQAAEALLVRKQHRDAGAALTALAARMPAAWSPRRTDGPFVHIAFWDMREFMDYVAFHQGEQVAWDAMSWSKLCYLQAALAVELGDHEAAFAHLDRGRALEPDHPLFACEEAYVLVKLRRYEDAMQRYTEVIREMEPRPWIRRHALVALRGLANCHFELGQLDQAEQFYKLSLQFEPGNPVAINELAVIAQRRARRS